MKAAIWDLVIEDMRQRDALGCRRYGKRLTANNGRDALRDAYEEALDLAVYLRQAIQERDESLSTTSSNENEKRLLAAGKSGTGQTSQATGRRGTGCAPGSIETDRDRNE